MTPGTNPTTQAVQAQAVAEPIKARIQTLQVMVAAMRPPLLEAFGNGAWPDGWPGITVLADAALHALELRATQAVPQPTPSQAQAVADGFVLSMHEATVICNTERAKMSTVRSIERAVIRKLATPSQAQEGESVGAQPAMEWQPIGMTPHAFSYCLEMARKVDTLTCERDVAKVACESNAVIAEAMCRERNEARAALHPPQQAPQGEASERVRAFLKARENCSGLDTEQITAFNGLPLLVADLDVLASPPPQQGEPQTTEVAQTDALQELTDPSREMGLYERFPESPGALARKVDTLTRERDEARAALPKLSEPAVLHAVTQAQADSHKQGDVAFWMAFTERLRVQWNYMVLPADQGTK